MRCACSKACSAAPPPRACSRRCVSAAGSPTRCSRSPTCTPTPARSGCTWARARTTSSEALAVIASELERCVEDPASEEELVRSRENLKGRVVLGMESTGARMSRLGASVLNGLPILSIERDDRAHRRRRDRAGARARRRAVHAQPALSAAGVGPAEADFLAAIEPLGGAGRSSPPQTRPPAAGRAGAASASRASDDQGRRRRRRRAHGRDGVRGGAGRPRHGAGRPRRSAARDDARGRARACRGSRGLHATRHCARERARMRPGRGARGDRHHRLRPRTADALEPRRPAESELPLGKRADRPELRDRRGADDALRRRGGAAHAQAEIIELHHDGSSTLRAAPPSAPRS